MSVKSSISLTKEQDAFARELVKSGRFASMSAVIQQSLELMRARTEAEELELAALRKLLARRRKGAFVSGEDLDAAVGAMIAAKRRA